MFIKNLILAFVLSLFAASTAHAGLGGECEPYTTCQSASAGPDGDGGAAADSRPQTFTETNSSALTIPVVFIPTGTSNDTGTEVATLLGVDCLDVIQLADGADAAGDELVAATCSTDIADGAVAIMFTY